MLDDFILSVDNKVENKEISIRGFNTLFGSKILHFFTYAAPLINDSIYVIFNLKIQSKYIGDTVFKDTSSFIRTR